MGNGDRGVQVGVFCYNEKTNLARTVSTLVAQLPAEGGRVIVFDESDDTVTARIAQDLVTRFDPLVEVRRCARIGKVARANELAEIFLKSCFRIMMHFDSDLIIPPSCISLLIKRIDEGYDLVSPASLSLPHRSLFERGVRALQRVEEANRLSPGYAFPLIGHSGAYTRKAVERIYPLPLGGFNYELYALNRASLAGLRTGVAPGAQVYFRVTSTLPDYIAYMRRGRREFVKTRAKYGPGIATVLSHQYHLSPKAIAVAMQRDPLGVSLGLYVLAVRAGARLSPGASLDDSWNLLQSTKDVG